ncbi:protoheme IX farnesyltransferase [Amylibacter sp. SFDW26]|uniref:heme o synthase n=1 Tax=Amylibacter sp. SFDW26 TaxID=2652722 RepID=UPI001261C668|nr:heme o synthase [Amylibacter sp. SFDW26]KAB7610378.1 protoheme IX farnesyltransferase [Amylibacter sp. SFDW26]
MADATLIDQGRETDVGDYFALLKPRVMSLVVFTALVGLLVAPVSVNPIIGFASILFVAIGAGASGALNMWWDADIDVIMKRTRGRPVPAGKVTANNAMIFGLWMSMISVLMLGLTANYLAAGLLAFTIFFYAVVYTMWLKRSTPQNIVIGGAAGAFPPMIGWAIATGGISVESVLMFALIFMWTPPHFWALALFMNQDYDAAGVPMLTVTHGKRTTRNHVLVYTILLVPVAMAVAFTSIGGPLYFTTALVLNLMFLKGAYDIWKRDDDAAEADNYLVERKVFRISLYYLFLHFALLLVEATAKTFGLTWAAWPQWI